MKYKKNKFKIDESLNSEGESLGNENFKKNFEAAKKNHRNNKIKYKTKRPKSFWIKLIAVVCFLFTIIFLTIAYFFSGMKTDSEFDRSNEGLGLESSEKINNSVTNIAVFGLDKRKGETVGRSDAIMVVSLDGIHKAIKITSILRDTRLFIDGHGKDKLGHAFSYGGANLAVKTLNKNFKLDIRDYVALNFSQMIHIIDAFGGIDVKIFKGQVNEINGVINSTPEYRKSPRLKPFKEESKVVHLNGAQALSFARIRKKDNEHCRATRQQIVVNLLCEKLSKMSAREFPGLLRRLMPYTETSLRIQDILAFVPFFINGKPTLKKDIIPHIHDKNLNYGLINGVWYWTYDLKKYSKILHRFIYET